ncbi:MAG: hypothetical protein HUJ51_00640 [Eggerthellaceae bacterium]|nr:hypothetical protein [Eggerthellaceae bacterium]
MKGSNISIIAFFIIAKGISHEEKYLEFKKIFEADVVQITTDSIVPRFSKRSLGFNH